MTRESSLVRHAAIAIALAGLALGGALTLTGRPVEGSYAFMVESAGVPLTNDLVLVIEDEDHKLAARVAARL